MSETKKKTAAPKPVSKKPYLTGKPLDSSCIGGALRFFLYLLMMANCVPVSGRGAEL